MPRFGLRKCWPKKKSRLEEDAAHGELQILSPESREQPKPQPRERLLKWKEPWRRVYRKFRSSEEPEKAPGPEQTSKGTSPTFRHRQQVLPRASGLLLFIHSSARSLLPSFPPSFRVFVACHPRGVTLRAGGDQAE